MADIIILDDSNEILEMLQTVLRFKNHHALLAANLNEFTAAIAQQQPQLFLLDVSLRDCDGREICKALKADDNTKHIPVVLMSANPRFLDSFESCMADAVLEKPFDVNVLVQTLESLL